MENYFIGGFIGLFLAGIIHPLICIWKDDAQKIEKQNDEEWNEIRKALFISYVKNKDR